MDFQFYVSDDRYEVQSLLFVNVTDEASARSVATRVLAEPHHTSVEVWGGSERMFTLRRPARPLRASA